MASAQVIYTGVTSGEGLIGTLFEGKRFWLSGRVPQRAWLKSQIEANGGKVVETEGTADIKLVDHKRPSNAADTYSYQYVEHSIRNGALEDLEKHAVLGPAKASRGAGDSTRPSKTQRTGYTAEDDKFLHKWVAKCEARGESLKGNVIFQQLEEVNDRHTWQSWRDHWVKTLSQRPKPADMVLSESSPEVSPVKGATPWPRKSDATPRTKSGPTKGTSKMSSCKGERAEESITVGEGDHFNENDEDRLLESARDILNIDPSQLAQAWEKWADKFPNHTAAEWKNFFHDRVYPRYQKTAPNPFRSKPPNPESSGTSTSFQTPSVAANSYKSTADPGTEPQAKAPSKVPPAKSLSYRPDSPVVARSEPNEHGQGASDMIATAVLINGSQQERPFPSLMQPAERPTSPQPSPKRQRSPSDDDEYMPSKGTTEVESELDLPLHTERHPGKRRRLQNDHDVVMEVPSTPDRQLSLPNTRTSSKASPLKSGSIDMEVEEAEREEISSIPDALSPTLTEPTKTPKKIVAFEQDIPQRSTVLHGSATRLEIKPGADEQTDSALVFEDEASAMKEYETAVDQPIDLRSEEQFETAPETQLNPPPRDLDTQAIITGETQALDFDLAEPDGGWDAFEHPSPSAQLLRDLGSEFDIPEPPGGWEALSSSPIAAALDHNHFAQTATPANPFPAAGSQHPSAPAIFETPSALESPDLDAWIQSHLSATVTADMASTALYAATMEGTLAEVVLENLGRGIGVPTNLKGVWTENDDEDLEGGDGRKIKWLQDKHGSDGVDARWTFLEVWRNS